MMKKNKKIGILIIVTFLLINYGIKTVAAISANCDFIGYFDGNGNSLGGKSGIGGFGPGCSLGENKYCNVNYVENNESVTLNEILYDTNGNPIGPTVLLKDKYAVISGRFIGIDAYEEYKQTFVVTTNPVCVKGVKVIYTVKSCYDCHDGGVCCTETTAERVDCYPCHISPSECRGEAESVLDSLIAGVDLNPSYIAKRQDVNDINKGVDKNKEPEITVEPRYLQKNVLGLEPSDTNSTRLWKTALMTYTYNLCPALIDPLTGKVTYEENCQEKSNRLPIESVEPNIQVPETTTNRRGKTIGIGNYFVPLNAKSSDTLKFNLNPKTNQKKPLNVTMCKTLIDNYSEIAYNKEHWSDFMTTINGEPLRNYASDANSAKDKVERDGGCRMGLYLTLHLRQELYHEAKNQIKGYNYYYRPIDYSKPFPNGMTANGDWVTVYNDDLNSTEVYTDTNQKDNNNSVSLNSSFAAKSYETNSDYKESVIRKYNHDRPANNTNDAESYERLYTSWEEMLPDGTSPFIRSGTNGVSRVGTQEFYKLGCGPANASWKQCQDITKKGVND